MYIFIASPMRVGNYAANIREAVRVADVLLEMGHAPFVPQLSALWEFISGPKDIEEWLELDKAWLRKNDALLRISGYSEGAEVEELYAFQQGIPMARVPFGAPPDIIRAAVLLLEEAT